MCSFLELVNYVKYIIMCYLMLLSVYIHKHNIDLHQISVLAENIIGDKKLVLFQ